MDGLLLLLSSNDYHRSLIMKYKILLAHFSEGNDFAIDALALANLRNEHVKINGFLDEWLPRYIEYDFFALFRMKRSTFDTLLSKIDCDDFHKKYTGGRETVPLETSLLMTLWWLGKGEVLLSVADRFNVSVSAVFFCTENILRYILDLHSQYISWPSSNDELMTVEQQFRDKAGFPGVVGAIDVCNINFKCPAEHQHSYIDRKMNHSIKLQAVATSKKIFTQIMVGYPGSVHDSRVLQNSRIYQQCEEENGNYQQFFPEERYHILGDSAYPLLRWIMTPYRDNGHLNLRQRNYNMIHSRTRTVIENTFGLLKGRWRILNFVNVNSIEKTVKIITACCILHNFCYIKHDFWEVEYDNFHENDPDLLVPVPNIIANNKRNHITEQLNQNV